MQTTCDDNDRHRRRTPAPAGPRRHLTGSDDDSDAGSSAAYEYRVVAVKSAAARAAVEKSTAPPSSIDGGLVGCMRWLFAGWRRRAEEEAEGKARRDDNDDDAFRLGLTSAAASGAEAEEARVATELQLRQRVISDALRLTHDHDLQGDVSDPLRRHDRAVPERAAVRLFEVELARTAAALEAGRRSAMERDVALAAAAASNEALESQRMELAHLRAQLEGLRRLTDAPSSTEAWDDDADEEQRQAAERELQGHLEETRQLREAFEDAATMSGAVIDAHDVSSEEKEEEAEEEEVDEEEDDEGKPGLPDEERGTKRKDVMKGTVAISVTAADVQRMKVPISGGEAEGEAVGYEADTAEIDIRNLSETIDRMLHPVRAFCEAMACVSSDLKT